MANSQSHRIPINPYHWEASDPLAKEHQLIAQFLSENANPGLHFVPEINFALTESGRQMREADSGQSARLVLALVAHLVHYDKLATQLRELATNEVERFNCHLQPEWRVIWTPRMLAEQALQFVMRRKLPLTREHLLALADWIGSGERLSVHTFPVKAFVKAVEAHGEIDVGDKSLRESLSRVVKVFRENHAKQIAKLAQQIENLLGPAEIEVPPPDASSTPAGPDSAIPAPVGSPQVLVQLKRFLGVLPEDAHPMATEEIGLDRFPLRADSPFRAEHELISRLLPDVVETPAYTDPDLSVNEAGRTMGKPVSRQNGRLLLALAERCANAHFSQTRGLMTDHLHWQSQHAISAVFRQMILNSAKLTRGDFFDVLLFLSALVEPRWVANLGVIEKLIASVAELSSAGPWTVGERHVLHRLRCQAVHTALYGRPNQEVARLNQMLRDPNVFVLVPGEAWSDAVNHEFAAMSSAARTDWLELFVHAGSATGSRPSTKWSSKAKALVKKVGAKKFAEALVRWFPLVNVPRTIRRLGTGMMGQTDSNGMINEDNATCLRGLLWLAPEVASPDLIRAIGAVTVSCYRKLPGVGARAAKVGNAGVYALSQINDTLAVGQLALLKVKVKSGSAQKEIEKAFNLAAERSGLPRAELEEMSVPTYGLTDVGVYEEKMGNFTARLTVTGTDSTELIWVKADGKTQRGVPAEVKASNADDLKELQAATKDIQKMLPAQRERTDGMFLQQRTWPLATWRERYLDHPLIGTLARRILWEFTDGAKTTAGIWFNGQLVNVDLKPLKPGLETTVRLWHPIGKSLEEITGWRNWLDAQQIQQPFKQAHREIYILTDAERNTGTYSNRYAAHVIRQHQFNALCGLRGWKNQLRLMVDADYAPPSLRLPQWNLRAEFWVEGIGQDYGSDTNESGVFLRLSTDQVRFYRMDAEQLAAHAYGGGYRPGYPGDDAPPLPLEEIPPLVFSEVMRDVDMFVGVASVGNDPTWADGGPQGRFNEYWQSYSFGDLNASAKTRKDVLRRLVPKLKIAGQCSFEEKFLIVKGSIRTYKIHLGSGNILMAPNDQYLCIVPKQGEAQDNSVLLPFEGDRTLSVILSKAFLLAADTKIKDPTIVSQIKQK